MNLFFRQAGTGEPLVILHGLFGSADNWYTLSKVFAEKFRVFTIDQRNHGQSPHSDDFNYQLLTEDLEQFLTDHSLECVNIIGHSMGGKTAMNFAVKNPSRVSRLLVVDIVPKSYPVHHDHILDGLMAVPISKLTSRTEADRILMEHIDEPDVRQFLLKNLTRTPDGRFAWKINLPALDKHIEEIGAGIVYPGRYEGPTLFVNGTRSNYFKSGDEKFIHPIFPQAEISFLDTSHWVQAEKPMEFAQLAIEFLTQ
jgi:esterase